MHDEVRGTAGTRHLGALLPLTAVAMAIAVHARALGTYFARDDITFLLRAAHHLPQPGPGRILSTALAISVEHAAFGLSPVGYHVVNLALRAVNVLGVYALALRLSSDRRVAWLAAVCFGTSSIARAVPWRVLVSGSESSAPTSRSAPPSTEPSRREPTACSGSTEFGRVKSKSARMLPISVAAGPRSPSTVGELARTW